MALVPAWIYSQVATYHGHQAEERQQAAEDNRREANRLIEACLSSYAPIDAAERFRCLQNAIDTVASSDQAEQDLKAQHEMAAWALAAVLISAFTLLVTVVGVFFVWRTLDETATATNLLGNDYIAAHPPKLQAFQVHLNFDRIFGDGKLPLGGVYLVNIGNSDADISGDVHSEPHQYGNIVIHVGINAPAKKPFEVSPFANPLVLPAGMLKAGGSHWWNIDDVSMVDLRSLKDAQEGRSRERIFIIGRVHFADTRGSARQTVFCRVYDAPTGRFRDAEIPDYEYQA